MASNYTGNPTAVQAPATAPAVNNPIVISIPAGTDVRTIESLTQAFKVLADNGTLMLNILGGTTTSKGLQADGVGGAAGTVTPGDVLASGTIRAPKVAPSTSKISTVTPNPALTPGDLFKDMVPFAGGYITNAAGTVAIACGFGISAVSRISAGVVDITLLNAMASTTKCFVVAMLNGGGMAFWFVGNTTTTNIRIGALNSSGTAADIGFTFVLYAS